MKVRPRPFDERSAYARCYGDRDGNVRIIKVEPKRPRYETRVSGEVLRRRFEERLATGEPNGKDQDASAAGGGGSEPASAEPAA